MSELVIAEKQDLINIADAIREKAGTTDGMGIDEMAALIAAIEAGGGAKHGTFTPSTYTKAINVGVDIPDDNFFFAVMIETVSAKNSSAYILCGYFTCIDGNITGQNVGTNKAVNLGTIPDNINIDVDRTAKTITYNVVTGSTASIYFEGAATFHWFLGGIV